MSSSREKCRAPTLGREFSTFEEADRIIRGHAGARLVLLRTTKKDGIYKYVEYVCYKYRHALSCRFTVKISRNERTGIYVVKKAILNHNHRRQVLKF